MVRTAVVLLFLLAMAAVQSPAAAQNCPPSYHKKNPNHTACKRRNFWCKIKVKGVGPFDRNFILKLHNEFRSQTALGRLPGFRSAADMQELLWDDELAYVAQAHANLCTKPDGDLKHDEVTDRFTSRFTKTGQNLAWQGRSKYVEGANWTWAMDGWFTQEYGLYPPENVSQFTPIEGVKIGHFTQVIWAATRYVGCGYVYYNAEGAVYTHMKQYTCNYGPTGNYVGEPIYKEGPTCSACPPSTSCNRTTGLCGVSSGSPPTSSTKTGPTTTPSEGQLPPLSCPPCPCLPTPNVYQAPASRYPGYRYPPPYTKQRRYPPYAKDPAPRRYPLPYEPRRRNGLPRCVDVEGYKPGVPGQAACVQDGGSTGLPSVDDSDGAHYGRPGRGAAIWLYFVAGTVTSMAAVGVLLGLLLVFWRFIGSTDGAGAKLSTEVMVTPAYSGTST
ncbi:hypothetical protein HPB49_012468 [Dermacentor silvarum]|uniref:Uncharacterized protein n=1 Tax=Dermacentor silvarum TaxID=543639 RepID=A0ACB8D5F2_DERSI|nr:CRISP/Allergen/PR-1 [Dermacentor silvarum]KAH7959613.1 hypothetical protein HPB49_012468 [Dermacentor silvarum]